MAVPSISASQAAASLRPSASFLRGESNRSASSTVPRHPQFISEVTRRLVVRAKKISFPEEAINIRGLRPLRRGKVSPQLPVPDHIPRPPYVGSELLPEIAKEHRVHDSEGLAHMRAACELAAQVVDYAGTLVRPSVTTNEIDIAVHQMIVDAGAYPSPLGYGGFPKSVCTSVNECMYHGIPDSRQLQNGDIINIDVAVYLNGHHGDTSKTFFCGEVNNAMERLVKATEECMYKGIEVCRDGALFSSIGEKISECAEKYDYGLDRFIGHSIGTVLHSEPLIFHQSNDKSGRMVEGQTFTIEPILTLGTTDFITWEDNWTILTADGHPAAQFEHTILVTRTGAEILTKLC